MEHQHIVHVTVESTRNLSIMSQCTSTYTEHLPEVWVSEPKGDVGHVESLGLNLAVCAFRYSLCWRLSVCLGGVICLLGNTPHRKPMKGLKNMSA